MRIYIRWVWGVLVMLCGGLTLAQEALPPYLYYFSPEHNALVIERADGTDQRLLGQGLASAGTDSARVHWSPSGKYVAWQTSTFAGPGRVNHKLWLMTTDGTERLRFFDALENAEQVVWSPLEDLLYVVDMHVNGATHYLINVETRQLITSFTLTNFGYDFFQTRVSWSPDGAYSELSYDVSKHVAEVWTERVFRRVVSRDGDIQDEPIERFPHSIDDITPTISPAIAYPALDMKGIAAVFSSPDGQWLYLAREGANTPAYLYHIPTQTRHTMEGLNGVITHITPSPDSRYFSLGQHAALLDVQTREIIPLIQHPRTIDVVSDWHSSSEWLIYTQVLYQSGGGNGAKLGAVMQLEDGFQRELSLGFTEAGWLPDAAMAHLTP